MEPVRIGAVPTDLGTPEQGRERNMPTKVILMSLNVLVWLIVGCGSIHRAV